MWLSCEARWEVCATFEVEVPDDTVNVKKVLEENFSKLTEEEILNLEDQGVVTNSPHLRMSIVYKSDKPETKEFREKVKSDIKKRKALADRKAWEQVPRFTSERLEELRVRVGTKSLFIPFYFCMDLAADYEDGKMPVTKIPEKEVIVGTGFLGKFNGIKIYTDGYMENQILPKYCVVIAEEAQIKSWIRGDSFNPTEVVPVEKVHKYTHLTEESAVVQHIGV